MSKNVVIFGENHWSMSKNPDVYGKPWGHVWSFARAGFQKILIVALL